MYEYLKLNFKNMGFKHALQVVRQASYTTCLRVCVGGADKSVNKQTTKCLINLKDAV